MFHLSIRVHRDRTLRRFSRNSAPSMKSGWQPTHRALHSSTSNIEPMRTTPFANTTEKRSMVRVWAFRLLENVRSVVVVVEAVATSMVVIDIHVEVVVVIMTHPDRVATIHRDKAVIRVTEMAETDDDVTHARVVLFNIANGTTTNDQDRPHPSRAVIEPHRAIAHPINNQLTLFIDTKKTMINSSCTTRIETISENMSTGHSSMSPAASFLSCLCVYVSLSLCSLLLSFIIMEKKKKSVFFLAVLVYCTKSNQCLFVVLDRTLSMSHSRSSSVSSLSSTESGRAARSKHWDGEGGHRLHLSDLAVGVDRREIEDLFNPYGPLNEVWVATKPPCFAFINFRHRSDGELALRELDGKVVAGSRIGLNWARPRFSGARASKRYRSPSPPYHRTYRYADERGDRRVVRNPSRSPSYCRHSSSSRSPTPRDDYRVSQRKCYRRRRRHSSSSSDEGRPSDKTRRIEIEQKDDE